MVIAEYESPAVVQRRDLPGCEDLAMEKVLNTPENHHYENPEC
jgi:hypothetical protein